MMLARSALPETDKYGRGMRWEPAYVMQCVIMRMKSLRLYKHIWKNEIIPVPSVHTLRKVISSCEAKFGFNARGLYNIQQSLSEIKILAHRYGCFMWDEVKLKSGMRWDRRSMKWKGVTDYGDVVFESDVPIAGVATHALVFMWRCYRTNGVQVFAIFATKNAAPGQILAELVVKALVAHYKVGAVVKNMVCDGCSTNKSCLEEIGISGQVGGKCYLKHPSNEEIKVYALIDVPHVVKSTKNHLLSHKEVQVLIFESKVYLY